MWTLQFECANERKNKQPSKLQIYYWMIECINGWIQDVGIYLPAHYTLSQLLLTASIANLYVATYTDLKQQYI